MCIVTGYFDIDVKIRTSTLPFIYITQCVTSDRWWSVARQNFQKYCLKTQICDYNVIECQKYFTMSK